MSSLIMRLGMAGSLVVFTGCSIPAGNTEPELIPVSWRLPVWNALAETQPVQSRGGISISVAPGSYTTDRRSKVQRTEYRPFLAGEDTRYFHVTEQPYVVVKPSTLQFEVVITNSLDRVFRGAGAVLSMSYNGQSVAVPQEGTAEFLNVTVIPRGRVELSITGPPLQALQDSGVVALFIYDVVTEVDDAGNPTKKDNFVWYYNLTYNVQREMFPMVRRNQAVKR